MSTPRPLRTAVTAGKYGARWASSGAAKKHPRTALFFPGQGVQRVGMTTDWLEAFPRTVKPLLEEIDDTLQINLTKIIAEGPNSILTETQNAQPAIMATSIMILRVLEQEFGFKTTDKVDVTLGHSLGEFAALVAGGYLRETDALKMVSRRAQVMAHASREASEIGGEVGMIAVVCEGDQRDTIIDTIHQFLGHSSPGAKADSNSDSDLPPVQQVKIANINSKNQIVLSGNIERIKTLLTHLRQWGGHDPRAVRLKADSPFHSPLMQPAVGVMREMFSQPSQADPNEDIVTFPGLMPCISNVSARPFSSRDELKDLVSRSIVETVNWHASIQYLHKEDKIKRWIGIGPGKVGRNLVGKEVGMKGAVKGGGVWGINDPKEVEEIMRGLEQTEAYEEEED